MTDDATEDGIERNRRRFLKTAAATTTVGFAAASGTASARTVSQEYADPVRVESLLERHGGDVLAALADDGLLARGDVAELPTRRPGDLSEARDRGGTTYLAREEGDDEFVSVRDAGEGRLRVAAQPGNGRVYAVHEPADEGTTYLYETDGSRYAVADDCCTLDSYCTRIRGSCDVLCIRETAIACPCGSGYPDYYSSCDCLC